MRSRTERARPAVAAHSAFETRCHCTALRKASRRLSQLYDAALAASGLKTTQYAILSHIGRAQPVSVGVLAEALVMDAGALAHTLKPLMRDDLVATTPDPADRRSRLIRLTSAGRAKVESSRAALEKAERGINVALGRTSARALRDITQRVISSEFEDAFRRELEST